MNGPVCSGMNTGRGGGGSDSCAACLLAFSYSGGRTEICYVDLDGSLVQLKEEEARRLAEHPGGASQKIAPPKV